MKKTKNRIKTPTYILTLRLKTNAYEEAILNKRFEIWRKLYLIISEDIKEVEINNMLYSTKLMTFSEHRLRIVEVRKNIEQEHCAP